MCGLSWFGAMMRPQPFVAVRTLKQMTGVISSHAQQSPRVAKTHGLTASGRLPIDSSGNDRITGTLGASVGPGFFDGVPFSHDF